MNLSKETPFINQDQPDSKVEKKVRKKIELEKNSFPTQGLVLKDNSIQNIKTRIEQLRNAEHNALYTKKDFDKNKALFKKPEGAPRGRGLRNAVVGLLGALGILGANEAKGQKAAEKFTPQISMTSYVPGLDFYTGGIEKTPTGKDNAFENAGLSQDEVYAMAKEFGLRTTSNLDFQTDLYNLAKEKYPELVEKVDSEYGQTKAGTKLDGILGVRVIKLLEGIKATPPKEIIVEKKEDQPKGDYIINIRGDMRSVDSKNHYDTSGRYFFFKDKADFEAFIAQAPSFTHSELGATNGQATYDMNWDVFNTYHAKNVQDLLQEPWVRNEKKPHSFARVHINTESKNVDYLKGVAKN